jgi:hypothetical protein
VLAVVDAQVSDPSLYAGMMPAHNANEQSDRAHVGGIGNAAFTRLFLFHRTSPFGLYSVHTLTVKRLMVNALTIIADFDHLSRGWDVKVL